MKNETILPKNIRQIGEIQQDKKIYLEDYVITFIRKQERKDQELDCAGILLGTKQQCEAGMLMFVKGALRLEEEVTVPLPVLVAETARFLPYAGSRVSPFRIVEIGLNLPVATFYETEKPHLDPFHPDIPVMAVSGSIVTALGSVCEAVTSVSVHILGRSAQGQPVAELVLPKGGRIYKGEGSSLETQAQVVFLPR